MAQKAVRAEVYVKDGNLEQAIRRLNKLVKKEGFLDIVREKQAFKKPSLVKHERNIRNKRRHKKEMEKNKLEERNDV